MEAFTGQKFNWQANRTVQKIMNETKLDEPRRSKWIIDNSKQMA